VFDGSGFKCTTFLFFNLKAKSVHFSTNTTKMALFAFFCGKNLGPIEFVITFAPQFSRN